MAIKRKATSKKVAPTGLRKKTAKKSIDANQAWQILKFDFDDILAEISRNINKRSSKKKTATKKATARKASPTRKKVATKKVTRRTKVRV